MTMNGWKSLWMALPMAALFAVALMVSPAAVAAQPGHGGSMMGGTTSETKSDTESKAATTSSDEDQTWHMMGMQLADIARVKKLLEEARAEAESAGDTKAVAKIDEALKILDEQHIGMHTMMNGYMHGMYGGMGSHHGSSEHGSMMGHGGTGGTMMSQRVMGDDTTCPVCGKPLVTQTDDAKVVNVRCPITGNKIDPDKVPADLTREWKGQKIGFCCAACPPAWDKLTDEQKQAKLDAAKASEAKGDED
jgi:hypothetical protein